MATFADELDAFITDRLKEHPRSFQLFEEAVEEGSRGLAVDLQDAFDLLLALHSVMGQSMRRIADEIDALREKAGV